MSKGEIVFDGPPQALLRRRGVYCGLVEREVARLATHAA